MRHRRLWLKWFISRATRWKNSEVFAAQPSDVAAEAKAALFTNRTAACLAFSDFDTVIAVG